MNVINKVLSKYFLQKDKSSLKFGPKIQLYTLIAIFVVALVARFLYFPKDVYFGIDQATASFAVQEILHGHLKLIGPTTTFPGLRHGVLFYYLYAPFYFLGQGNPIWAAAFLRVANASGVFLIFFLANVLFNEWVGIIASWLFAISFEQTQFALYFSNPSMAVVSFFLILIGFAILFFKKKQSGLIWALLGLGTAIQFNFLLTYLFVPFILTLIVFRKSLPGINSKTFLRGSFIFLASVSTFILAELKFHFTSIIFLSQLLFSHSNKSLYRIVSTYIFEIGQIIKFSIVGSSNLILVTGILLLSALLLLIYSDFQSKRKQLYFLSIWFFSVLLAYIVSGGENVKNEVLQYHQNVGVSICLITFTSYLLYILGKKSFYLASIIFLLITIANVFQIQEFNPSGSIPQLQAQSFELVSDEERVLDYIYSSASGKPFAVKGITLPIYIDTTWSYLFEWYGNQKYHYLPIWGGKNAVGYPGNLIVEEAQSKLPSDRYLIIEPTRGIPYNIVAGYLQNEEIFSGLVEEKHIGSFVVQKRVAK